MKKITVDSLSSIIHIPISLYNINILIFRDTLWIGPRAARHLFQLNDADAITLYYGSYMNHLSYLIEKFIYNSKCICSYTYFFYFSIIYLFPALIIMYRLLFCTCIRLHCYVHYRFNHISQYNNTDTCSLKKFPFIFLLSFLLNICFKCTFVTENEGLHSSFIDIMMQSKVKAG